MRAVSDSTILLTGATDGLGKAVATALTRTGATVLLHGRDEEEERGRCTRDEIAAETGSDRPGWYRADLASLADVRGLAEAVTEDHERLDVLVNNAGIGTTLPGDGARLESGDGFELRFAVNYLAPYLLTRRTFMPTKMVLAAGVTPLDSLETGIQATMRLVADPALDGVSGRYFDRQTDSAALAQAYDEDARARLRELSDGLVRLGAAAR